jgi:hypothetical protein
MPSVMAVRCLCGRLVVVGTVVLCSNSVKAGNLDSFYLGNDAALQAGAITADATGGGAIWYNPAGLGRFGSVGLGLGVFVPTQITNDLHTRVFEPSGSASRSVDFGLDYTNKTQEYFAGPSIGVQVHRTVYVGGSLLAHYRSQLASATVHARLSDLAGNSVSETSHESLNGQQIGGQLVLGIQFQPSQTWHSGITLRLPTLRMYQFEQTIAVATIADGSVSHTPSTFADDSGMATTIVKPARLHVGLSHDMNRLRLAADLNYQTRLRSTAFDRRYRDAPRESSATPTALGEALGSHPGTAAPCLGQRCVARRARAP